MRATRPRTAWRCSPESTGGYTCSVRMHLSATEGEMARGKELGAEGGEAEGFGGLPWVPKNLLVPYLLLALSYYRAHGYLLQQYLRTLGFFGVDITTIYRTLRQMEKQGLVDSAW